MTGIFIQRWAGLALIAQAALTASPVAQEGAQNAPFRVDVKLVNVFVTVTDQNGSPVGGLSREDFSVAEESANRDI